MKRISGRLQRGGDPSRPGYEKYHYVIASGIWRQEEKAGSARVVIYPESSHHLPTAKDHLPPISMGVIPLDELSPRTAMRVPFESPYKEDGLQVFHSQFHGLFIRSWILIEMKAGFVRVKILRITLRNPAIEVSRDYLRDGSHGKPLLTQVRGEGNN
jgi:hypothetical protein